MFPPSGGIFSQLASLPRRAPHKSVRPPSRSRAFCRKHSRGKCERKMENERKGAGSRLRHASHFRSYDRESSGSPAVTSRGSDRAEQPLAVNELELLKPVSRSFYLSIRLLPRALREPVALAYLLARTSDTIADSSAVDAGKRSDLKRTRVPSRATARSLGPNWTDEFAWDDGGREDAAGIGGGDFASAGKSFDARSARCSRTARNHYERSARGFDAMGSGTGGIGQCGGTAQLHLFGCRLCRRILDARLFSQSAEFHRT